MRKFFTILCGLLCLSALAAEVIPPVPTQYFNDYAGVVSAGTAAQLNRQLEQFERDSSDQIVVAIYPKMQSDSSIEDYTVRVAQSWKIGQQGTKNGVVLFVFIQDHKMFIQTGYGMEGVLPDITCKRIIENEIAPRFKAGDYDAGLSAGVNALIAATKGEYKGTGGTVREHKDNEKSLGFIIVFVIIFLLIAMSSARRGGGSGGIWISGGGWSTGRSWGGGGGGGGGFSAGGGSFGGGGAGGSW